MLQILLFNYFLIDQHVSSDKPPIIRRSKTVIAASSFTYVFGCRSLQWLSHRSGRQPKTYVNPEAAITDFEFLLMGGVSPESFWAIKKHWNNKFYYKVASCWFFLWDLCSLTFVRNFPLLWSGNIYGHGTTEEGLQVQTDPSQFNIPYECYFCEIHFSRPPMYTSTSVPTSGVAISDTCNRILHTLFIHCNILHTSPFPMLLHFIVTWTLHEEHI